MTRTATRQDPAVSTVRAFPLITPPLAGESLDSWLEANAVRLGVTVAELYEDMGFRAPFSPLWRHINVRLTDGEAEAIAAATGRTPDEIRAMTLSRYAVSAVGIDRDTWRFTPTAPWGRVHGSRFCPHCLGATGGAWQLQWRLIWTFVCPLHCCLLADHCPRCGAAQRFRYRVGPEAPHPGQCANPTPGAKGTRLPRCDADLGQAPVSQLPATHPVLAAQARIDDLLAREVGDFGIYTEHRLPAVAVLADIRTLGQGILSAAQGGALDSIVPADLSAQYRTALAHHNPPHDDRYPRGRRFKEKPPLAVSTAVAVTAALSVVGCASIGAAAEALAELYARVDRHTLEQAVAHNGKVSGSASPVLQAVYAASLGARLTTVEQLHRRLGSAFPGPPIDDSARRKRLTRYTPTLLWPSWSLRLCPPSSFQRSARPALSVAVLLVHTTMGVDDAGGRLGGVTTHGSVVTLLGNLKQSGHWDDIRAALIRLADYLDVDGAPIDYQRRRRLEYTDLLPDTLWRTLARDTFTRPEGAATARDFLRERLSGSPVIPTPVPSYDYQDYDALLRFPVRLNPELLAALDDHAREFLAAQRVTDEPIWWEPPTELLHDLRLPGPDIEAIDTAELHRLLRREQLDLGEAAARIGVSADAARCALESHPAHRDRKPAPKPKIGPRHPGPAYLQASSMFPRDRFVELYEHQYLSLRDLAAIAGVSKPTITELARDYAIAIRDGRPTPRYVIDREWLYTEHVTNGRSLSDLARELGVSVMTVSKWAKIHHIPVRGLAWRTADTLRANDTLPPLLIPALAGQGGWERLQRFADIARYPSYSAAARQLHVPASTLGNQVRLLERDLGKHLVAPTRGPRPMTLTAFGRTVLAAVEQLAAAGGP